MVRSQLVAEPSVSRMLVGSQGQSQAPETGRQSKIMWRFDGSVTSSSVQ